MLSVQNKRSRTVYLDIHEGNEDFTIIFEQISHLRRQQMKKKEQSKYAGFFTSNFSVVKAVSFSAKKLFYWKIPARVQSCGLAVSVGFWSSTPAGI